jgi:hypothetical protein
VIICDREWRFEGSNRAINERCVNDREVIKSKSFLALSCCTFKKRAVNALCYRATDEWMTRPMAGLKDESLPMVDDVSAMKRQIIGSYRGEKFSSPEPSTRDRR